MATRAFSYLQSLYSILYLSEITEIPKGRKISSLRSYSNTFDDNAKLDNRCNQRRKVHVVVLFRNSERLLFFRFFQVEKMA